VKICKMSLGSLTRPMELNIILDRRVVLDRNGCALHTFGCIEWESDCPRFIGEL